MATFVTGVMCVRFVRARVRACIRLKSTCLYPIFVKINNQDSNILFTEHLIYSKSSLLCSLLASLYTVILSRAVIVDALDADFFILYVTCHCF